MDQIAGKVAFVPHRQTQHEGYEAEIGGEVRTAWIDAERFRIAVLATSDFAIERIDRTRVSDEGAWRNAEARRKHDGPLKPGFDGQRGALRARLRILWLTFSGRAIADEDVLVELMRVVSRVNPEPRVRGPPVPEVHTEFHSQAPFQLHPRALLGRGLETAAGCFEGEVGARQCTAPQ